MGVAFTAVNHIWLMCEVCHWSDDVQEFLWKQIENIYFRDKKFSVQVHDASSKRCVVGFSYLQNMSCIINIY